MKSRLTWTAAVIAVAVGSVHAQSAGSDAENDSADLETVLITAQREARTSTGATGLNLSLTDTPQSLSVVDRDSMDQFHLDDINKLLSLTTGVNVEESETDRFYYNARGFDILSMQVDGTGMPISDLVVGSLDTALYDKVEVVRGANGLLTGTGNPSGTVNYVRKRPTNDTMASIEATVGTWNHKRVAADFSTPLVVSGQWAARVVGVYDDTDSWLNLNHKRRKALYGIVDGQLGDRTTLAAGYTHQDSESKGVMWGAIPLQYNSGVQTDFDVSSTITQAWTYWDVHTDTAFAELGVQLFKDWQFKTVLTYNWVDQPSELFYTYPDVTGFNTDGTGLLGDPGKFHEKTHSLISDSSLSGSFDLWGQQQQVTLGLSLSKSSGRSYDYPADPNDPAWGAMPSFPGWTGYELQRPAFGEPYLAATSDTHLYRVYGAMRFAPIEPLKFILGFNAVDAESEGVSWGTPANKSEHAVSPYVGATWRVVSNLSLYASYSDIFQPQSVINADLQPLGSAKGKSYEAGLKGEWFDKQLFTTLSVFKAEQQNLQQFVGYAGPGFELPYYEGIDVVSKGYELEVAGKLVESLKLSAGYTHLNLKDPQGVETRTFIPRNTLKVLLDWRVPELDGLTLGASARWQNTVYLDAAYGRIYQPGYAVYGLKVGYEFNKHFELNANLDNVADKKYLTSLYWDQAYYAQPRMVSVSARWKY